MYAFIHEDSQCSHRLLKTILWSLTAASCLAILFGNAFIHNIHIKFRTRRRLIRGGQRCLGRGWSSSVLESEEELPGWIVQLNGKIDVAEFYNHWIIIIRHPWVYCLCTSVQAPGFYVALPLLYVFPCLLTGRVRQCGPETQSGQMYGGVANGTGTSPSTCYFSPHTEVEW